MIAIEAGRPREVSQGDGFGGRFSSDIKASNEQGVASERFQNVRAKVEEIEKNVFIPGPLMSAIGDGDGTGGRV